MTNRSKVLRIFLIVFLVAAMLAGVVACTPRTDEPDIQIPDPGDNVVTGTPITKKQANEYIGESLANRKQKYTTTGNEEWFVLDFALDFRYNDYTSGSAVTSALHLDFKANFHLSDNMQSQLLLELRDNVTSALMLGVYYYEQVLYVSVLPGANGYPPMNYYMPELNLTKIGQALSGALDGIGGIDPVSLIMGIVGAQSDLDGFLAGLGVNLGGLSLNGIINSIAQGILFDLESGSTVELSAGNTKRVTRVPVQANGLLDIVKTGLSIPGVIDIKVAWETFGLPDLDPILEQFLGFSLRSIREKNWPPMFMTIGAVDRLEQISRADGTTYEGYVLEGMTINIDAKTDETHPIKEFDANIDISPFLMTKCSEPTDIDFAGKNLSTGGTKYTEGGLLDFETSLSIEVDAAAGSTLVLGDVLGGLLDLGSIGSMPITFGANNSEGDRTHYEFNAELKVDLDLFDGANNRMELNILYDAGFGELRPVVSVYLIGDSIYVDTTAIGGENYALPNLSLSGLDLTALLFGDTGLLSVIMPYLDPNADTSVVPPSDNPENLSDGSAVENAGTGFNINTLFGILANFYEREDPETGEILPPTWILPYLTDDPANTPMSLTVTGAGLTTILGMFMDIEEEDGLGLKDITVSVPLSGSAIDDNENSLLKLEVNLTDDLSLKIKLNSLAYMGRPDFRYDSHEEINSAAEGIGRPYNNIFGDNTYHIEMGGYIDFGIDKSVNNSAADVDLGSMLSGVLSNLLINIGVTDFARTSIGYKILANFDMKNTVGADLLNYVSFGGSSLAVHFYLPTASLDDWQNQRFLSIYYDGTSDYLYIDFSNLGNLQQKLSLFKFINGQLPNISVKLGLEGKLEFQNTLTMFLPKNEAAAAAVLEQMGLYGYIATGSEYRINQLDIMGVVGQLLSDITLSDNALSVVASAQLLNVLMNVLGVKLNLPEVNLEINLDVINGDTDVLSLHFGIIDKGSDERKEFVSLNVVPLTHAQITAGEGRVFDVSTNDFTKIEDLMKNLSLTFELHGNLYLEGNANYDGFDLDDLLGEMLGGALGGTLSQILKVYVETKDLDAHIEFTLKLNLDLSEMSVEGGTVKLPNIGNSELHLNVASREYGDVFNVYLKGGTLYVQLEELGMANIAIDGVGDALFGLVNGTTETAAVMPNNTPDTSNRFYSIENLAQASNTVALAVQVWISPYSVAIALAGDQISNLLAELLGLKKSSITVQDTEIVIDTEDGIALKVSTGIETIDLEIGLSGLGIWFGDADAGNNYEISVPNANDPSYWQRGNLSSIMESVHVKLEAEVSFSSTPDAGGSNRLDLSPVLGGLLPGVPLDAFIDILGGETAGLVLSVDAYLNLNNVLASTFRLEMTNFEGSVILVAIYKGYIDSSGAANGDLYVKTSLFGLSPDKFTLIPNLMGLFGGSESAVAETANTARMLANTPEEDRSDISNAAGYAAFADYIKVTFAGGKLALIITEDVLVSMLSAFGIDLSPFFDEKTAEIKLEISATPVYLDFSATVSGINLKLGIGGLSVDFAKPDLISDDLNDVEVIDDFGQIGVDVTAELSIESLAGADGKVYFDSLVKNLLDSIGGNLPLDKDVLSGLGVLVELIGKNGGKFEGSLYVRIQGIININDINNLYLSLKVGTVLENDKLERGDVLDVSVFGATKTTVDAAGATVTSMTANVYVDAENLTGIKPFVVEDVAGLISSFTATALSTDVVLTSENGVKTVYENPLAKLVELADSEHGDQQLAAQILLQIAVEYEDYGMSSPIVASVTSGAIYAILLGLAGIDISAFLDGHDPEVSIGLFGGNTVLTLTAGLKDALKVSAVLNMPTVTLSPVYPEAPKYDRVLGADKLSAFVEVEGNFDLQGKTDGENDVIKVDEILNGILGGTQFGVLINLLTDISASVHFRLAATVNIKSLLTGDWNGLNAFLELKGGSGKLLVGVYYFDEDGDGQNDLLLDLSALNMGKMRIDGFARFMQSLISTFAPPSVSTAFIEAQNAAPYNENGEKADNTGILQAYINLSLGMDKVLALHVGADVVALLVAALNLTDNEGNPLISGEEIVNTVNGILGLDIWAFDIAGGSLLGLKLSVASYTLGLALDRIGIQIDPPDKSVVGDDFDASGFGYVGEMTQDFYMKAEMSFGWNLKSGTKVDFGELLASVLAINNLALEPVLSILEDISEEFTLSVEAKIHFGNLLANGELLNDLMFDIANGRYDGVDISTMFVNGNIATMTDSEGNNLLIIRSGAEGGYTYKAIRLDVLLESSLAVVLSDDKGNEVLSIRFNGGNLYVNLAVLGIGKFVIENAYTYLLEMFTPLFGLSTFGYALDAAPAENSAAYAAYIAKETAVVSQFININVSPEAFAVQISSSALFAVLKTLGLDVNNIKLSDQLVLDLENAVNSLGSLDISAELLGENKILALKLALNEWMTDADGNKLPDPDKYLSLSLGINNNLTIKLVSADMPPMLPPEDRDAYDVFDNAQMSFATRIEFNYALNNYSNSNINKEPLSGLLGNFLSDLIIQLGVNVVGDYEGTIAADIRANIRLLDLINEITSGQLSLSSIQAEIKLSFNEQTFLTVKLVYGDIFIDMSALNGPKLRLRDFASLFAPAASTVDVNSSAAVEQRAVARAFNEGTASENNVMPISIEVLGSGLYVVLRNAAFNALFAMLGLQPFEMFEELSVTVGADGDGVGVSIDIKDGGVDFLSLGLAINELSLRMSPIPERPTEGDDREPMTPPTIEEQRDYKSLTDINTVLGSASFEVSLSTRDGAFEFANLLNSLWDASALLGKGLAPKLTLEDVLGDTIRIDLDIVFNTSLYETVSGAHYYISEGRLVIGGNTYTVVGSDIRDIANRSVGSLNERNQTFELDGTNYSYTDEGVVRASKGVQRILEGIQVKAHVYSLNNQDYFDLYIYFVKGVAYIDAECLGISKVKIPVNSVMELIAMFTGGSVSSDINAATAVYSDTAPAYYDAMDRLFAAPLDAYNAAGKTVGIVDILLNRDGLLATVGSGLLFGVLRLVGLSDQMVTAIENTARPEISLSVDNRFTLSLGVDINAVTSDGVDPARISLGASIITENIKVGTEVDSSNPEMSIIEPLISQEEAAKYISFDELEIYTELNMSLSLELLEGKINLDAILDLIIATMKADLNIAETHRIDVKIGAKLGVSLKNFLSFDDEAVKDSVYGELSVAFEISDATSDFEQEVLNIAIRRDGIYATVNLFDSTLKVKVPDFTVGELLYGLLGLGKTDTSSVYSNPVRNDAKALTAELPVSALYKYAAEGRAATGGDALDILLSLNSKEFSLEISLLTVTTVLSALGFGDVDLTALVSSVFDGGKLGVNYDGDFYIYLNIGKAPAENAGGYDLTLKLLHDTYADLSGAGFNDLKSRLDAKEFEDYAAFDLNAILNGGSFDIIGFIGKIGASVDLTISAELKEYLVDWSKLFEDNSIDSLLYIQINEALSGAVTLTLAFDVDIEQLLKGKLAVDAAFTFKNAQGDEMLSLAIRGLGRYGDSAENDLVLMLHVPGTPMPDFVVSGRDVDAFIGLDYNKIIDGLLSGLGLTGDEKGKGVTLSDNAVFASSQGAGAPSPAGIVGDDNGFEILPGVNIATLLDSLSLTKGKVAIVLTKNIVEQLLLALFGFPFEDIQGISVAIDLIENEIALNINLAAVGDTDETALGFGLAIGGLDISLGGKDLFTDNCFLGNSDLPIGTFANLSELKTEIELRSELLIDDKLISFFDLSDFTNSLLGMDVVLRSGEQLHIAVELVVKIFIDFSDIGNIGLSLGIVYDGKQYVGITFKGDGSDGSNSTAYVDLSGLGLPAVSLKGIDIETIIRDLMATLVSNGDSAEAATLAMPAMTEVLRTYSANGSTDRPFAAPKKVEIPVEDLQYGTALLLLTISSKEFALSITGALAASLIRGITEQITLPQFNRLTIGYVEEDDGTLRGLRITLDEDEMFMIQFGFTGGSFRMGPDVQSTITAEKDFAGNIVDGISNINVLKNIYLSLHAEVRLKTTNDDDTGKSRQVEDLETLVETLVGMPDGSFDLSLQTTSMVFTFDLEALVNIADFSKTQLYLEIGYGDMLLIGVYYTLPSKDAKVPQAYVDLSGLGLFKAAVTGIDLVGIIGNLLGSFVTDEGLNIGDMISGLLGGGKEETANVPQNPDKSGPVSMLSNAADGQSAAKGNPTLTVVFTNSEIIVSPNVEVLEKLTGIDLPDFLDIRISMNLKEGLNNLALNLKIDQLSNSVQLSVPVGNGLKLALNHTGEIHMPANFAQYGGVNGVSMSMGSAGLNVSIGTRGLINSLVDSIYSEDLTIVLEKRNSYWARTKVAKWFDNNPYVGSYGPTTVPENTKTSLTGGDYVDYRHISETSTIKRSVLTVSRTRTNVLEVDGNLNNNGLHVIVAYNAGRINLKIPSLIIYISVQQVLDAIDNIANTQWIGWISWMFQNVMIPINVGAILNTFVPNGINVYTLILNSLIPENRRPSSSLGTIYGTALDESGEPLAGVQVAVSVEGQMDDAENVVTTVTDDYGNYAVVGLEEGVYEMLFTLNGRTPVSVGNVDVKGLAHSEATRKDVYMLGDGGAAPFTNVTVTGRVLDNSGAGIKDAQMYLDGAKVEGCVTDTQGNFTISLGQIRGQNHAVGVTATGYVTPAEANFTITSDNEFISGLSFVMEAQSEDTSVTLIQGVLKDKDGKPVQHTEVKFWLAVDGKTHLMEETDGNLNLDPVNFFDAETFTVRSDASGRFYVEIPNEYLGDRDNAALRFKVRSEKYNYVNIDVNDIKLSVPYYLGEIELTERDLHWSQETLDKPIAGIRVRLGADKLDQEVTTDSNDSILGIGGNVEYNLINGIMDGEASTNDSVSYVELWINSDLIGNLLGDLMYLLAGKTAGFTEIATDARLSTQDLVPTDDEAILNQILQGKRYYNENDERVFDYRWNSRTEYAIAAHSMITRLPAAFLATLLGPIIKQAVSGFVLKLIELAAENALGGALTQIGDNIAALLQFPLPYNVLGGKDLQGNLLDRTWGYDANFNAKDELEKTEIDADGDGTPELTRSYEFLDRAVYVKLTLNAQADALIESASVFINGIRFEGEAEGYSIPLPILGTQGVVGGYIDTDNPAAFNAAELDSAAGDGVERVQVMVDGVVNTERLRYVLDWIAHSAIESYFIVEDKNSAGEVVDRYYFLIHESKAKDGAYMEISLVNSGLSLRAGSTELGGAEDNKYFNWSGSNVRYSPPSEIIFNDPYDPTDFTFVGGSWANESSGTRTNTDTTKSVYDFLPERYEMSFADGTSTGSNGVGVFWSYDSVNFDPKGGSYSLVGACLNQIIEIPVTVRPRLVDPAQSEVLSNVPVIDPMNFDRAAYIASLPKSFADPNGQYVFNNLEWSIPTGDVSYSGGEISLKLTYSMTGTGDKSNYQSAKATIDVPARVMNRTVVSVDTSLEGSINGIVSSTVWFDPFEETDPVARLRAVRELVVSTVEGATLTVAVAGFDAASMWNYRPDRNAAEQRFTVYYELRDSLGNVQRVPVTVVISSKKIVGTTVSDLSVAARTIVPYVDGGIYSKDIGLNLPATVTVRYEDGTTAMLYENVDYVWGGYRKDRPSEVFAKENFADLFTAFTDATYVIGLYTPSSAAISERNAFAETEFYSAELYVSKMELYSVPMLRVSPSEYYELPTSYEVLFNDGRDRATVSVEWSITVADLLSSFNGGIYASDVAVRGALFETQTMPNVRVDVDQIIVESVDFGEYEAINPFNLANEVKALFAKDDVKLNILGGFAADRRFFDIVGCETVSGWNLDEGLTTARFKITVANKGYNPAKPETAVWTQTFAQTLKIKDVSNLYIHFNYVDRDNPNNSGEKVLPTVNSVAVSNALDGVMPTEIWFEDGGERYGVSYETDGLPDDAYTRREVEIRIIPDAWPAARKTIKVVNYNTFETMDENAVGFAGMPEEISSLSRMSLPEYADVELLFTEGGTVNGRLPVEWRLKNGDSLTVDAAEETVIELIGRVGQLPFGFFEVEKTVTLTPATVTDSGISGALEINPLTGEKQTAVEAVVDGTPVLLSIIYPSDIEITYEGGEYLGHYVYLARITELAGGTVCVRAEVPADITVLSRRVVALKNRPEGSIYSEVDFDALKETTVVFDNGEEMTTSVVWSGVENITYTVQGGVSYVYATVFAGMEGLEHSFRVPVRIRQAILEAVYTADGTQITGLSVDPYVGFVNLPTTVFAKFYGSETRYEIAASWNVAHIIRNMTVEGGAFTAENQNAAEIMIYLVGDDGEAYAQQTMTVDVTVENRSIVTEGAEGNETVAVEFTRKDGSVVNLNAGNPETGSAAPVYDRETNTVRFSMNVNPYAPATGVKYSEDRNSADFYYFDGVTFTLEGGVRMTFGMSGIDYRIYDNDSKLPTVTNNLYTGRNVVVEMRMNADAVYDADGNQVLARNAAITVLIDVRILNMTYVHGGGFSTSYTVDMYGEWFGDAFREVYDAYIGYNDLMNNVLTENYNQTVYVAEGNEFSFVPERIYFDTSRHNPNFTGGSGTVYAKFGNEMGGEQSVAIRLDYLRRVLTGVFDASSITANGYQTNVPHYFANLSNAANQSALGINASSVERITNRGTYGDAAFLLDPFDTYDKETYFPNTTVRVSFDDGSADGLFYDASASPVSLNWDTGRMFVDYYGSVFSVKAAIGEGAAMQAVSYRLYTISRKVVSSRTENPFDGLVSASFDGIRPYKYMYAGNVGDALAADIFTTGSFDIRFEEGAPIRYTLGRTAATGQIVGNSPLLSDLANHLTAEEADTVMNFTLDAGQGLNSDGRDVRFYITVPGFGMGKNSKQTVSLYLKSIPEKIYDARALENGSPTTFANYWRDAVSAGAMTHLGGDRFHVSNPYYFIMQGGMKMPDRVRIYVNETGNAADGASASYDINAWWNNSNGNIVRVHYYDQEVNLSFNVDLDNQLYDKLKVSVTPRILPNDVAFDNTRTEDNFFGEEEVILLPTASNIPELTVGGVSDGFATDDYSYTVSFGSDLTVTFGNINGGGTSRNDINKWNFSGVKWDFAVGTWEAQAATLTLGGRGGQQIKWRFKTVDKTWVNSSISTVQVFAEGSALDFSKIGGTGSQLPKTVKQFFDVNYYYSGSAGYSPVAVPVTYGELLNNQMQTSEYYTDASRPQFTFDRASGTLTPTSTAATPVRKWQTNSNIGAAAIRWTATTKRAYPAPNKDIGGYVYVAYASANGGNTTQNTYIVNPTREAFSYEAMAPSLVDWRYRAGMSALNGVDEGGNVSYSGLDYYYDTQSGRIVNAPIISVNANTKFDTVNLPLYEVQVGNDKYVNFVDWNSAEVWYSPSVSSSAASFVTTRTAGGYEFAGMTKLRNGIFDINTSSRTAQSGGRRGYGTYYIVAKVPGVAGAAGEVVVAVETVG